MIRLDKKVARALGLQKRALITQEQRLKSDEVILKKVTSFLRSYQRIAIFVSFGDEVNTHPILSWCFEHGKDVFVPKVEGKTLSFYQIHSFNDLKEGVWGILEPYGGDRADLRTLDIMLVPLSSYDKYYNRTGYGKGFYDSVLPLVKYKVGLAYHVQKMDETIETEAWDIALDDVICEA